MCRTDLGMSAFERSNLGASNDVPTVIFEDILAILGSLKVQQTSEIAEISTLPPLKIA